MCAMRRQGRLLAGAMLLLAGMLMIFLYLPLRVWLIAMGMAAAAAGLWMLRW